MAISRPQFCVNLLTEFFKPGGPLLPKSQLVEDKNTNNIMKGLYTQSISDNSVGGLGISSLLYEHLEKNNK